jgi:tripartite-type tricarboxylate transporter receptor subunit TctC
VTRPTPLTTRRQALAGMAVLPAFAVGAVRSAPAQDRRPLQIVVGYPPGGGSDVLARVLGEPLSKLLGRPVIVMNVPGASGQIAATNLLRDGGDGLSILAINHPDLFMAVERSGGVLKAADFQIMAVDVRDPRVFLVKGDSEIDSFATFVARAKAQPGQLAVSVTAASAQELFAKWLFNVLGIDVIVVGYKGGAEAANALLTDVIVGNIGDDFGRLSMRSFVKALFVGAQQKSPRWPEAPTLVAALAPFGITPPTANFLSRYGVYVVPSGLKAKDPAAYLRLQQALLQARASQEFQGYIARSQLEDLSIGKAGEDFESAFAADMVEVRKIK